jgi:hypothetical protein
MNNIKYSTRCSSKKKTLATSETSLVPAGETYAMLTFGATEADFKMIGNLAYEIQEIINTNPKFAGKASPRHLAAAAMAYAISTTDDMSHALRDAELSLVSPGSDLV